MKKENRKKQDDPHPASLFKHGNTFKLIKCHYLQFLLPFSSGGVLYLKYTMYIKQTEGVSVTMNIYFLVLFSSGHCYMPASHNAEILPRCINIPIGMCLVQT